MNRLTHRTVEALKTPGLHADGDGLYLRVDERGSKRWVFVFQWQQKRKEMGLGPLSLVSLADAREERLKARRLVYKGLNPIEERKRERAFSSGVTFGSFAEEWLAHKETGWKNEKHRQQWRNSLKTYAASIWGVPVSQVTTEHLKTLLLPIWETKAETASRVRGRIERVLDAARVSGVREGENPARWKGHLETILAKRKKLVRGHHAALPFRDAPAFIAELRQRDSQSAKALEFTILTAARTSETLKAKWCEFDLERRLWTIPAERMKAGREHRVPLTDAAVRALGQPGGPGEWVFPGTKRQSPLSNMTMTAVLKRMGRNDITVHGFRSTFRDWAGETSDHPREVVEAALAHIVGDATERAYRRGDALPKRRRLMADWERFLLS
ncbi:MAG: integrase arm-type DNA-binding domain-containing protein [Pseudomonadota bacterium]